MLGDVKTNGQTTPGLIQERVPLLKLNGENGLLNTITREAAKMADDNGRTNDAILLCHLAGEYDSVISILNRALAEALSVEIGQEPLRLEPFGGKKSYKWATVVLGLLPLNGLEWRFLHGPSNSARSASLVRLTHTVLSFSKPNVRAASCSLNIPCH